MVGLHEKQKKILEYLLDHASGVPLGELAAHLSITKTAAKEHLIRLEGLGLLTYRDEKGGVGRPKRHYLLSPEGHESFPRQYSWLSNSMLEFLVEDLGKPAASRMMEALATRVSASMKERFARARSGAELLAEITKVLNELGYRAVLRQSDLRKGAIVEATNCVYHSVAKAHPELCRFDTKFLESASGGMRVELESCIARGGEVCRFCLRKAQ